VNASRLTALAVSSAVEHRAGSVDLLAAWPATAHPPNHGPRRIIASTATSRDLLAAAQSRVQEHRRVFMAAAPAAAAAATAFSLRQIALQVPAACSPQRQASRWHSAGWCPTLLHTGAVLSDGGWAGTGAGAGALGLETGGQWGTSGVAYTPWQLKIDHWTSGARSGPSKSTGGDASNLSLPVASAVPHTLRL
jgi:hypothetical protein